MNLFLWAHHENVIRKVGVRTSLREERNSLRGGFAKSGAENSPRG